MPPPTRGHRVPSHQRRSKWKIQEIEPDEGTPRVVAEAGLETAVLTPTALHHTAASMAIAAGVDVTVVQRILGHADASMTLNTSTDLWPDRPDGVSDTMSLQRTRAPSSK